MEMTHNIAFAMSEPNMDIAVADKTSCGMFPLARAQPRARAHTHTPGH